VQEKQQELDSVGMRKIRESRPKEQQRELRIPYDERYEAKIKITCKEASSLIQKQYREI
jgi:hypothetical protein